MASFITGAEVTGALSRQWLGPRGRGALLRILEDLNITGGVLADKPLQPCASIWDSASGMAGWLRSSAFHKFVLDALTGIEEHLGPKGRRDSK